MSAERLTARLAIVECLHALELALARGEHAKAAAALVRGKAHSLGNSIQVARLASLQLEQRCPPELKELIVELVGATDQAIVVLGELITSASAEEPDAISPLAPAVRGAVVRAGTALATPVELTCDLGDDIHAGATPAELEGLVLAMLLDADGASRIQLVVRTRSIGRKSFVQLIRITDSAAALSPLVEALAQRASGEASLAPGRDGFELAIELPNILAPSSI